MSNFCVLGSWRIVNGRLIVPADGDIQSFRVVPTPPEAQATFNQVVRASDLRCVPRLVWLADARGRGGFFSPGLVAVGAADQARLASTVWHEYLSPLTPQELALQRMFEPSSIVSFDQVRAAGLQYVLGHEVGHATQFERGARLGQVPAECDADTWSGVLGEYFGWDPALQRHFAHAIGCTGAFCTHPAPDSRVVCYDRGRERQRSFEAQQAWRSSFAT